MAAGGGRETIAVHGTCPEMQPGPGPAAALLVEGDALPCLLGRLAGHARRVEVRERAISRHRVDSGVLLRISAKSGRMLPLALLLGRELKVSLLEGAQGAAVHGQALAERVGTNDALPDVDQRSTAQGSLEDVVHLQLALPDNGVPEETSSCVHRARQSISGRIDRACVVASCAQPSIRQERAKQRTGVKNPVACCSSILITACTSMPLALSVWGKTAADGCRSGRSHLPGPSFTGRRVCVWIS